jgi:hypothetical protein
MRALDLADKRYGRLTFIKVVGRNKAKQRVWLLKCDCGNYHEAAQNHVTGGHTTSCGCYHKDKQTTHGMCRSPEWFAYQHAKARCKPDHKAHEHYFDRGIRFSFDSFEQFFAEVGLRPSAKYSLDRIDNDKGYESGNLRWATKKVQERNKRCDNCSALKARIAELEAQVACSSMAECSPVKRVVEGSSPSVPAIDLRATALSVFRTI